VAQELLFAFEMAPRNFRDGELNIPESGNGVPDVLDEACLATALVLSFASRVDG
jgi:endoglucanase